MAPALLDVTYTVTSPEHVTVTIKNTGAAWIAAHSWQLLIMIDSANALSNYPPITVTDSAGATNWSVTRVANNNLHGFTIGPKTPSTKGLDNNQSLSFTFPIAGTISTPLTWSYETASGPRGRMQPDTDPAGPGKGDIIRQTQTPEAPPPPAPAHNVSFTAETPAGQTNILALAVGALVTLTWQISDDDAQSATIYGRFPGHSYVTIDRAHLKTGHVVVDAITTQPYVLEVNYSQGDPVRELVMLDVSAGEAVGDLQASPQWVLPYGTIQIAWNAWSASSSASLVMRTDAGLSTENTKPTQLLLAATDETSSAYAGSGTELITITDSIHTIAFWLEIDKTRIAPSAGQQPELASWEEWDVSFAQTFAGDPVSMAYNGQTAGQETLALIAGDHTLWLALIDEHAGTTAHVSAAFTPRPSVESAWLAVVAFESGFVGLRRQTSDNHLELVQLDSTGAQTAAQTVVVPDSFNECETFQLAALQSRVYLTGVITNDPAPVPISVQPGQPGTLRAEGFLWPAVGCSLHSVNNTLCALNHTTGGVLCYGLAGAPDDPTLKPPQVGAGGPASIQGIPLVVQDILVVLGCATHTDWVYDPYSNTWQRCGQGLDWQSGVAVYRPSGNMLSGRLFALHQQDQAVECKTLMLPDTDSAKHFFMPNHLDGTLSSTRDDASAKYASSSATAIPADTTAIMTYPAMLPVYFDLNKQLLWYEKAAPPNGKILVIGPIVSAMYPLTQGLLGDAHVPPAFDIPDWDVVSMQGLVDSASPAYFTHLRLFLGVSTRGMADWPDAQFEIHDDQQVLYSSTAGFYSNTLDIPLGPNKTAIIVVLAITGTHIKNGVEPITWLYEIPPPSASMSLSSLTIQPFWGIGLPGNTTGPQGSTTCTFSADWTAEVNINGTRIFNRQGVIAEFTGSVDVVEVVPAGPGIIDVTGAFSGPGGSHQIVEAIAHF